jgi:hypothetical protein
MTPLEHHRRKKAVIEEWYRAVLADGADWLPAGLLSGADRASLAEARDNLVHERFVVAVCGQMKAGKSTLLNALIFGEPVLPSAATTMTAKVTLMEGAARPRVEATLYTQAEFDAVVRAAADGGGAAELRDARDAARRAGLLERALLTSPARVEVRDSFRSLPELCAVPSEGGLYTAYVKSVHLWADRPWLHQVTVADTPGTNDPNPERDKVTREWINQADAVVYVTYAGQAGLDANDVEFIDKHLRHIQPDKRIIAVNKIDTEDNPEAILNHFRNLGRSPDLRLQALFGDQNPPVLVSGLAGLIEQLIAANRPVDPRFAEDADFLGANGWLSPHRHRLGALREEVEARVLRTKGDALLTAHRRKLEAVFSRVEQHHEDARRAAGEGLRAAQASDQQLRDEMALVQAAILDLDRVATAATRRLQAALDEQLDLCAGRLHGEANEVARLVVERMQTVGAFSALPGQAAWAVPAVLRQRRNKLRAVMLDGVKAWQDEFRQVEASMAEELLKSGLGDVQAGDRRARVDVDQLLQSAEARVEAQLDGALFAQIVDNSANFLRQWANTGAARRDAVENLRPALEKQVFDAVDVVRNDFNQRVRAAGEQVLGALVTALNTIHKQRFESLQQLQQSGADRAQIAKAHHAALREASARLDGLAKVKGAFAAAMEAA